MGLRGWSYGYDYYAPEISVAYHMYAIKENKSKRKKVKLFWENSNLYPGSAVEGMKRLNGIIGTGDPGDTYYDADEFEYGLGKVRPKEQFYRLYGIHTETKTVEDHLCSYVGKVRFISIVIWLLFSTISVFSRYISLTCLSSSNIAVLTQSIQATYETKSYGY